MDLYREEEKPDRIEQKQIVDINTACTGGANDFYWKNLITFGRAAEGLRSSWREQLRELQEDIGFKYIRFHGVFLDDMMICNRGKDGKIVYNWTYLDDLFDFLLELKLKPFLELSFMPSEMKSSDSTVFWWEGNISPPKHIGLWENLVKELLRHCINRYGKEEVESWYFEVWNEPSFENMFWSGSRQEYFKFYHATVDAIKSISGKLRVGGPSISYYKGQSENWLEAFLYYCRKEEAPIDFISIHIYPEAFDLKEAGGKGAELIESLNNSIGSQEMSFYEHVIYYGKDHTGNVMDLVNEKIKSQFGRKKEIHVTEWSASAYSRNLINDTCFVAAFIIRNALKFRGKVDSLGYWTFTDIMEEQKLGVSPFHGGFGLISKDGIKKPSYFAYYLLSKLGDHVISRGEDYIATRKGEDVQILAYNFAYLDELFIKGDISRLDHHNRYEIYEYKEDKNILLNLKQLKGAYKLIRYQLNRNHGSCYDEWVKLGAPENMAREEINYLKGKARPKITVEHVHISEDVYDLNMNIPVHGAELIMLEKQV